jgi:hypothetical protein
MPGKRKRAVEEDPVVKQEQNGGNGQQSSPVAAQRVISMHAGETQTRGRSVAYWMSRDQRTQDNWALLHAQTEALARGVPLVCVCTCVSVWEHHGSHFFHYATLRYTNTLGCGFRALRRFCPLQTLLLHAGRPQAGGGEAGPDLQYPFRVATGWQGARGTVVWCRTVWCSAV